MKNRRLSTSSGQIGNLPDQATEVVKQSGNDQNFEEQCREVVVKEQRSFGEEVRNEVHEVADEDYFPGELELLPDI